MAAGLARLGVQAFTQDERRFRGELEADVAVFYGLQGNTPALFDLYSKTPGHAAMYIDLGYWGRREGGRFTGYHKIAINDRHPTRYLMDLPMPPDRFSRFGVQIEPWAAKGPTILLAGMGDKGAIAEGYAPEEFERWAIAEIRKYTDRPIVYRPKPSWKDAKPIPGVGWSPRTVPIETELRQAWAVVTHHSNVGVDAAIAGVPVFTVAGVAKYLSMPSLAAIDSVYASPFDRHQWAANLAYTQWSIDEMRAGLPWKHALEHGLI